MVLHYDYDFFFLFSPNELQRLHLVPAGALSQRLAGGPQ